MKVGACELTLSKVGTLKTVVKKIKNFMKGGPRNFQFDRVLRIASVS